MKKNKIIGIVIVGIIVIAGAIAIGGHAISVSNHRKALLKIEQTAISTTANGDKLTNISSSTSYNGNNGYNRYIYDVMSAASPGIVMNTYQEESEVAGDNTNTDTGIVFTINESSKDGTKEEIANKFMLTSAVGDLLVKRNPVMSGLMKISYILHYNNEPTGVVYTYTYDPSTQGYSVTNKNIPVEWSEGFLNAFDKSSYTDGISKLADTIKSNKVAASSWTKIQEVQLIAKDMGYNANLDSYTS